MRIQASLEFLMIASAIGALALGAISIYGSSYRQQLTGLQLINSTPAPVIQNQTQNATPRIFAFVEPVSYLGQKNGISVAVYGCPDGNATVGMASNSMAFQYNSLSINVTELGLASDYFVPLLQGQNRIIVSYSIRCGMSSSSGSMSMYTYSTFPGNASIMQLNASQISASISGRNESIVYPLVHDEPIYTVNLFSHCTYMRDGSPENMGMQCGSTDGWYYFVVNEGCYWSGYALTETDCAIVSYTGYNVSSVDTYDPHYNYSFMLSIGTRDGQIASQMRGSGTSNMLLGGVTVGSAYVKQAAGDGLSSPVSIMDTPTGSGVANQSAYEAYEQAKNSMFGIMKFYNSSTVSSDIQSTLQESASSFIQASSQLTSSGLQGASPCGLSGNVFSCPPVIPLSYVIIANLSGIRIGSSVISYMGSQIEISGS